MKNKGNEIIINVTSEDTDLLKASKRFINELESEHKKFKENFVKIKGNDEKYSGNSDFFFHPEKLSKKSPLTILNAPWGTGKTYFIENILKLMIDKKLKSNIFKKMLIIDAWKFSNSKDVPIEFIEELSKSLISLNNIKVDKKEERKIFRKLLAKLAPWSLKFSYQDFSIELGYDKNEETTETQAEKAKNDKLWKNIENNGEPTIIFIDNLERLGSLSWDLLKAVMKLQEFDNFIIVLPLNINKIKNNDKIDNSEYPIEKYIDIALFNFKQDYFGYFKDKVKGDIAEKINNIFLEEINGEKLSIREVDQSVRKNNLSEKQDLYEVIKTIYKYIWQAEETITKILIDDVTKFLELKQNEMDLLKEIYNAIIEKMGGALLNFESEFKEKKNSIIDWDDKNGYYFQWDYDYIEDIKYLSGLIEDKQKYLSVEIKNNDNNIKKLEQNIKKSNMGIIKQESDISKWNKHKTSEGEKEAAERDSSVITNMNNNIATSKKTISDECQKILGWETEKSNLNARNDELKANQKSLFDIKSYHKKYLNATKETKLIFGEKQMKDIVSYLKSIENSNKLFNDDKNEELENKINDNIIKIISD